MPANSVKDLVDLAKTKPGAINVASAGSGSTAHLSSENRLTILREVPTVAEALPGYEVM